MDVAKARDYFKTAGFEIMRAVRHCAVHPQPPRAEDGTPAAMTPGESVCQHLSIQPEDLIQLVHFGLYRPCVEASKGNQGAGEPD